MLVYQSVLVLPSLKLTITNFPEFPLKNDARIEDVFPIENGDILAGYFSLPESTLPETNQYPLKNDACKMRFPLKIGPLSQTMIIFASVESDVSVHVFGVSLDIFFFTSSNPHSSSFIQTRPSLRTPSRAGGEHFRVVRREGNLAMRECILRQYEGSTLGDELGEVPYDTSPTYD